MQRTLSIFLPLLITGCITGKPDAGARARVTPADPAPATNDYWFDRPATATAEWPSYPTIWAAARQVALDRGFAIARADYRGGTMTTDPLVSAQWFEPWRQDVVTPRDRAQSSLQTVRRTIRFDIVPAPGGTFRVTPKVVVERQSFIERRVTSAIRLGQALTATVVQGNQTTDQGLPLQDNYWYATGRDEALERALADQLQHVIEDGPRV
ncbi:MAG TPA: hypothetical protein VK324_04800 [Tepidisphaeraceae bacterium]|nr:hypothetical protein [Tepidisphaeraceae bacterium]